MSQTSTNGKITKKQWDREILLRPRAQWCCCSNPGASGALWVVGRSGLKDAEGTRDLGWSWSRSSAWEWARYRCSDLLVGKRGNWLLWTFKGCSCHERELQEQCFSEAFNFPKAALALLQAPPSKQCDFLAIPTDCVFLSFQSWLTCMVEVYMDSIWDQTTKDEVVPR